MKPWSGIWKGGGVKRRRAGRRRSGLQEGVRSFWFKMRFSFIYLFSWAHSSRLSACFLLYVLWPQCPLPPPPAFFCVSNVSGSASANMCVCMCAHAHLHLYYYCQCLFDCMCANAVWVRLFCVSQQCLLLHATVITAYVFICKKWESVLAVQGWMVSFGIDLFYYVCASHAVQLSHTQAEATYPSCWRAQCTKTAQIMPRSENKSCFVLLFFFFFYKFTLAFPPTTLKSILYLLGHKNVCEERWLFDGLRVGFQLLEHLSIIYQIDFQPWW